MPRVRTVHRCRECGATSPRWTGRCPVCEGWNTLVEEQDRTTPSATAARHAAARTTPAAAAPVLLADIDAGGAKPRLTGIDELDRVLGGGLVPGSVTLIGGEPGIGKSTLLLQVLASLAAGGARCLLISAEESAAQVRARAGRLGAISPSVWMVAEAGLADIRAAVDQIEPDVVVVDSIQTVWDAELDSPPGSVTQVRGCAQELVIMAKTNGCAVVLVGHVTKDGSLAGPRVLEHLVDTVITFEGDRHHALRLLRTVKHRFGGTGELGVFEMTENGLTGVSDASSLFLGDRRPGTPGATVFPALEGHRPLLVEVQALVVASSLPAPRRSVSGVDSGRLALLLAVLQRHAGIATSGSDVYVSVVGGVRIGEPGVDLAVCLALASAINGQPLPDDLVVLGEVGLGGEIRRVPQTPRRLAEAARLGFARALVPAGGPDEAPLPATRARTLAEALLHVFSPADEALPSGRSAPAVEVSPSGRSAPAGRNSIGGWWTGCRP